MRQILGFFAGRQNHGMVRDPRLGQAVSQRREVVSSDDLVRHDDDMAAPQQGKHLSAGALDQTGPDQDVITSVAELYPQSFDRIHRFPLYASGAKVVSGQDASAAIARVTVVSGDPSPLSTATSASA